MNAESISFPYSHGDPQSEMVLRGAVLAWAAKKDSIEGVKETWSQAAETMLRTIEHAVDSADEKRLRAKHLLFVEESEKLLLAMERAEESGIEDVHQRVAELSSVLATPIVR